MDRKRIEALLQETAAASRKTKTVLREVAGELRRAAGQVVTTEKREEMLQIARELEAQATNGKDRQYGWLN
jgi:predicted RNA-binding Zn ribbon-like protein